MLPLLALMAITYAHPEQLVDTAWVAAHAADANVRVVNSPPTFLPAPAVFEEMMAKLGISDSTRVIVYDERGGIYAARLWWILNYYGHTNVALMNGGWLKWTAEQRPTSTNAPAISSARFTAKPQPRWVATASDVVG